jgi:hypothetical protein
VGTHDGREAEELLAFRPHGHLVAYSSGFARESPQQAALACPSAPADEQELRASALPDADKLGPLRFPAQDLRLVALRVSSRPAARA